MNSESSNSTPERTAPRLRTFLRKATAIIAAERGLNAACQIKLQTLAEQLKLPEELFQTGLDRLQNSKALNRLTRYEKSFLEFLEKEFGQLKGDVLSPGQEKKAIELARTKYQIDNVRSEQLLNAQAELCGIARISSGEAYAFASDMIGNLIGNSLTIDDARELELQKIGLRWGLEAETTDQIILEKIGVNRKGVRAGQRKRLLTGLLFTLVILASVFGVMKLWPEPRLVEEVIPAEVEEESNVPMLWLDEASRETLLEFGNRLPKAQKLIDEIDDPKKPESVELILRLSNEVFSASNLNKEEHTFEHSIASIYYHHPSDQVAMDLITKLLIQLDKGDAQAVPNLSELKSAFFFASIVAACLQSEHQIISPGRKEKAIALVADWLSAELPANDAEARNLMEIKIANEHWQRLIQNAWLAPESLARLVQPLSELTQGKLDQESLNRLETTATLNLLSANPTLATELQSSITKAIQFAPPSQTQRWFQTLTANRNKLSPDLGRTIADKLQLDADSIREDQLESEIRIHFLNERKKQLAPVLERSKKLDELVRSVEPLNESVSANQIARLAWISNLEITFCLQLTSGHYLEKSSFQEFDRSLRSPVKQLNEIVFLARDREQEKLGEQQIRATASDRRKLRESIERISDLSQENEGLRVIAANQLKKIAARFKSLNIDQANSIAAYLLSEKISQRERLNNELVLDSLAHLSEIGLAIVDLIPESDLPPEETLALARLMYGRDFQVSQGRWKSDLQIELLSEISRTMSQQLDSNQIQSELDWNRLRVYMGEILRERAAAFSIDFQIPKPDQLVPLAFKLVDNALDRKDLSAQSRQAFLSEISYIAANKTGDMRQLAALENLFAALNSEDPNFQLAVPSSNTSLPIGEQLRKSELRILKSFSARRLRLIEELITPPTETEQ